MLVGGDKAFQADLALAAGVPVGCIALRRLNDESCGMKRLYVREAFRGRHIGELLVRKVIADAKSIGYRHMLLGTLPFLKSAMRVYKRFGFESYNDSPGDTSMDMGLDL